MSIATCDRGSGPVYTIQTNGTKLDQSWAAFFKDYGFLVGISIDGPREIHDTSRLTRGGRGSFDQFNARTGSSARRRRRFQRPDHSAWCQRARGVEVYQFLRDDCWARSLQFIPVIGGVPESDGSSSVSWSP
ncbi:MAG TPA: hypothetical protein VEF89_13970 [Solirubrobacteraceae bacterium]|nr:hypothetical protein [Solirubrobacteraceae bacterium]